jgi:hypothetical protein
MEVGIPIRPLSTYGEMNMRFMIIVRATPQSEAGTMPDEKVFADMAEYHEQLAKAGVLLNGSGGNSIH